MSDTARILLKHVVNDLAFPLELKLPNAQTRAAMEEAREKIKARATRFESADALSHDLEQARKQQAGSTVQGVRLAKAFLKDWERLSRSGRYDLKRLKEAMLLRTVSDGSPYRPTFASGCWPISGAGTAVAKQGALKMHERSKLRAASTAIKLS